MLDEIWIWLPTIQNKKCETQKQKVRSLLKNHYGPIITYTHIEIHQSH